MKFCVEAVNNLYDRKQEGPLHTRIIVTTTYWILPNFLHYREFPRLTEFCHLNQKRDHEYIARTSWEETDVSDFGQKEWGGYIEKLHGGDQKKKGQVGITFETCTGGIR